MARKRRPPSKAHAQRAHFKRALLERYALVVTRADVRVLLKAIARGQRRLIRVQSERVQVMDIVILDQQVRVVYDANRKELVTALPSPATVTAMLLQPAAALAIDPNYTAYLKHKDLYEAI